MTEYNLMPDDERDEAIELVTDLLPDEAELAVLSFTGSRAFGWGGDRHDIDLHGWFALEGWFRQCHTDQGYDLTVRNIETLDIEEARLEDHRWKKYYDLSNTIYVHDEFDFDAYMDRVTPEHVLHAFPYDCEVQMGRLEKQFTTRTALHTYKELLIPLYFLETGDIESNIIDDINSQSGYEYEWLDKCADRYKYRDGSIEIEENEVWEEIRDIYGRLEAALMEQTDYDPEEEAGERWS